MAGIGQLEEELKRSYEEAEERVSDPAVFNDHRQAEEAGGRLKELERPYRRIADHRIKLTLHRLDQILNGDLGELTDALSAEEQRRALEAATA